jgi:MFS family permease
VALWESAAAVVKHPVAFGYTIAVGFVFAAFNVYLATCQQIFAEQYQQGSYFALWFGGFAVGLAIAMIVNGRTVKRLGMRPLSKYALWAFIANWGAMLVVSLLTAGQPPLAAGGRFQLHLVLRQRADFWQLQRHGHGTHGPHRRHGGGGVRRPVLADGHRAGGLCGAPV